MQGGGRVPGLLCLHNMLAPVLQSHTILDQNGTLGPCTAMAGAQ